MPIAQTGAPHHRLGLGVGMDLPWGQPIGFDPETGGPSPRVTAFLQRYHAEYEYLMFSFQPRGAAPLDISVYLPAYERLASLLPEGKPLVFHQTTLNLGAAHKYD